MNSFLIHLRRIAPIHRASTRAYRDDVDNVTSVLMDICDLLADEGSVEFLAAGFGQPRWPVDVRFDLPAVIEQVPQALNAIDAGRRSALDFFEQGIERRIEILPDKERVVLRCNSRTAWSPDPAELTMPAAELRTMLLRLMREFVAVAAERAPEAVADQRFVTWTRVYDLDA